MAPERRDIFLICQDEALTWKTTRPLVKAEYTVTVSRSVAEGLGKVYETPPALILLHEPLLRGRAQRQLRDFKKDTLFAHIPVVLLVSPEWQRAAIDWEAFPVEDFLCVDFKTFELLNRTALCLSRFKRALDPNPLTRLPGNTSILRAIQRAADLAVPVCVCYLDIDNFKAFNDAYGFARGDEALRMTARILSNSLKDYKSEEVFVGHVGGDDFVFLVPQEQLEAACSKIIATFDAIIPSLYDDRDRKTGSIVSKDRSGKKQTFPLMSVSIAVVPLDSAGVRHYGQVSEIASQIKKRVKKLAGSNYLVNRRR